MVELPKPYKAKAPIVKHQMQKKKPSIALRGQLLRLKNGDEDQSFRVFHVLVYWVPFSGLPLRNLNSLTRIRELEYLLYSLILVTQTLKPKPYTPKP